MKKIFLFLISVWFMFAILSVFLNLSNVSSEIKKWAPLSEYEKKEEIFGNLYTFLNFASSKIPDHTKTLVYSDDIRISYFAIYVLYPKNIIVVYTPEEFNKKLKNNDFKYVVTYDAKLNDSRYGIVSDFRQKNSKDFGFIYKLNE